MDTTGPALTLPGTITQEATSAAGATVTYPASALDAVDGASPELQPAVRRDLRDRHDDGLVHGDGLVG